MSHCQRFRLPPLSRREMLRQCANGFGSVALAALLNDAACGATSRAGEGEPLVPRQPHFEASARNVIFLFMDGGPSQVDTFDPKPRLAKEHGQPIKMKTPPTQFNNVGAVLKCPWTFKQHGQSGI